MDKFLLKRKFSISASLIPMLRVLALEWRITTEM